MESESGTERFTLNAGGHAEVAAVLRRRKPELARALMASVVATPKWSRRIESFGDDVQAFLESDLFAFVDYLALWFETGDDTWRDLYVGEKLKQLFDPDLDEAQGESQRDEVLARDLEGLGAALTDELDSTQHALFLAAVGELGRIVQGGGAHQLSVLFVGDCLFQDVVAFLAAPAIEAGISIVPSYATSKNPPQLREEIKALVRDQDAPGFDLVFFSPFTYEFSPGMTRLLRLKSALQPAARTRAEVDAVTAEAEQTVELLAELFDCPIFVHNALGVIREDGNLRRGLKHLVTSLTRRTARRRVQAWLEPLLARVNDAGLHHLFQLDERRALAVHGENELGRYAYRTPLQHPAVLGKVLAADYADVLYVRAWLLGRKLVVCDLDDTLWEGTIGEGAVQHHHDRQQVLKDLQAKGVVLAINSKNDPENVTWQGGLLDERDFVASSIDWEPKVKGMQTIQQELNLKYRDWIFVDDRPQEREFISQTLPEIHCVDPTQPVSWRRLALWAELLDDSPETDRTELYRTREERKRFVSEEETGGANTAELFESLGLQARIWQPSGRELKRVTELINRTNQFNLCGSRTTLREVSDWCASDDVLVLAAEVSDRFGTMGTVSVAVAMLPPDASEPAHVSHFVLSCRVFGYGVETALLNRILELTGPRAVTGSYRPTPRNHLCANFYGEHGFVENDGLWRCGDRAGVPSTPGWLSVDAEAASRG